MDTTAAVQKDVQNESSNQQDQREKGHDGAPKEIEQAGHYFNPSHCRTDHYSDGQSY